MKHLLIGLLCLCAHAAFSQVYKFKSFVCQTTLRNKKGEVIHKETNHPSGIPVVINYKTAHIMTYGEAKITVTLDTLTKNYTDEDGNSVAIFWGRDQSNTRCATVVTVYKNPVKVGFDVSVDFSWPLTDLVFGLKKQGEED